MKLPWVRRAAVAFRAKRLAAEIDQQKSFIAAEKKKLDGLEAWTEEWQTAQQGIANFTGRVFGLELGLSEIKDLLR